MIAVGRTAKSSRISALLSATPELVLSESSSAEWPYAVLPDQKINPSKPRQKHLDDNAMWDQNIASVHQAVNLRRRLPFSCYSFLGMSVILLGLVMAGPQRAIAQRA